jgi:hypothetical protein
MPKDHNYHPLVSDTLSVGGRPEEKGHPFCRCGVLYC